MSAPRGRADRDTATVTGRAAKGEPAEGPGDAGAGTPGSLIIWLSWAGTGLYVVLAAAATAWPRAFQAALMAACVLLFVVGFAAFAAAYVIAVGRSRTEAIGMGGLYFLSGTAPRAVQRSLIGSLAVETVAAVVSASIGLAVIPADADNLLAFGVLTPLYGLGLAGLWGARHGTFPPRPAKGGRPPTTPHDARVVPPGVGAEGDAPGSAAPRRDAGGAA